MAALPTNLHVSRVGWAVIALVVLLPWAVILWLLPKRSDASRSMPAAAASAPRPVPEAAAGLIVRGPWGELEAQPIMLEPPEEFIRADTGTPDPLRWTFRHTTAAALDALWVQAGLAPADRAALNATLATPGPDLLIVSPSADLILRLSPAARATIYGVLAALPENRSQHEAFRYRADRVDEWFAHPTVSPEIMALTRRLLYRQQNVVLFADEDVVLPRIASLPERLAYLKMMARRSGLIVRLRVPHGSDVETLARYWRHSRRTKSVKPLLASLAMQPDGGSIDIIHLLPPFARSLINTYPDPATNSASHDCHWTSFNFLEETADERYSNIDYVKERLLTAYYPVTGESALGDILVFIRPDGVVVHSCIHVADGIVFTKNGSNVFVPWTLSRLENVIAAYASSDAALEIRRYRLKQP